MSGDDLLTKAFAQRSGSRTQRSGLWCAISLMQKMSIGLNLNFDFLKLNIMQQNRFYILLFAVVLMASCNKDLNRFL